MLTTCLQRLGYSGLQVERARRRRDAVCPDGTGESASVAGQVHLTWDTPHGTDHFRCFEQKPGETVFTFVTDNTEAELLLDGQASGTTVQLYVTAVSSAGESVPSGVVSVAVG